MWQGRLRRPAAARAGRPARRCDAGATEAPAPVPTFTLSHPPTCVCELRHQVEEDLWRAAAPPPAPRPHSPPSAGGAAAAAKSALSLGTWKDISTSVSSRSPAGWRAVEWKGARASLCAGSRLQRACPPLAGPQAAAKPALSTPHTPPHPPLCRPEGTQASRRPAPAAACATSVSGRLNAGRPAYPEHHAACPPPPGCSPVVAAAGAAGRGAAVAGRWGAAGRCKPPRRSRSGPTARPALLGPHLVATGASLMGTLVMERSASTSCGRQVHRGGWVTYVRHHLAHPFMHHSSPPNLPRRPQPCSLRRPAFARPGPARALVAEADKGEGGGRRRAARSACCPC